MSRLPKKSLNDLTEAQRELFDRLKQGRDVEGGHIGGPFDAWLLNPDMGGRITGLGNLFRFRTSVDRRYVELAILMTGAAWRAQYEWYAHAPMAREAGLPDEVIDAIWAGREPRFDDEGDEVAYRLIRELMDTTRVSDATFGAAEDRFRAQGVAELVNVAGYYVMVSMTLNTFDVPLPEGVEPPFAETSR
ncbi:MAG: carboxymuconolactone decarboxylase family protein [Gammaproteobacteria bacterium]|nr:carboxymuconolactone decarboxylase family protein [Gammaproteobacteria bacterium]